MAAEEGDVDVASLLHKSDKIKALMRRDPRFIGRLITVSVWALCRCVRVSGGAAFWPLQSLLSLFCCFLLLCCRRFSCDT